MTCRRFENVGRLKEGAPVTLAGVSIGRVLSVRLDPERLNAVVTMRIRENAYSLPTDTDAAIVSDGLLGSQYIALTPGGLDTLLKQNDEIELTQSAVSLEHLIGKYLIDPPDR